MHPTAAAILEETNAVILGLSRVFYSSSKALLAEPTKDMPSSSLIGAAYDEAPAEPTKEASSVLDGMA